MKPTISLLSLALALLSAQPVLAQHNGPTTLTAQPLKGGAYWVSGGVSNSGFVVGDKGVIVIDTQINPVDAGKAIAEIAKVTPKPINAVIVSHGDPDHIGGLTAYPATAAVIEHEGTPPYVQAAADDAAHGGPFGAAYLDLVKRPPTKTIGNTETVTLDGVKIVLMHLAPAHTAGDLVVYLPAQKTVFAADMLLTNMPWPVIHLGGTTLGWLETMKAALALDADTYVPGHGPIVPKAKVAEWVRNAEARRDAIKAMVTAGKSLAEIEKAYPEPASPFPSFAATVYRELTVGYPKATPPWANMAHP